MFSELCSSTSVENPQSSIEHFLDLQTVLARASAVADALNGMGKASMTRDVGANLTQGYQNIQIEKGSKAELWVRAALLTDLAPLSLLTKPTSIATSKKETSRETSGPNDLCRDPSGRFTLVLEKESSDKPSQSKNSKLRNGTNKGKDNGGSGSQMKSLDSTRNPTRRKPGKLDTAADISGNAKLKDHSFAVQSSQEAEVWIRGSGLKEIAELAKSLQQQSRNWFFGYFEAALDSGFHLSAGTETSSNQDNDNSQIVTMLSQLKRVNDWLDHLEEEEALVNTLASLKQKIYHFLMQHVELAAIALGNQAQKPVEN
jgi:hypothetical protein